MKRSARHRGGKGKFAGGLNDEFSRRRADEVIE
jgi:hypothetical protein